MTRYRLSAKADSDFAKLYEAGIELFGARQADTYAANLITAFDRLSERPFVGFERHDLGDGLRCLHVASHSLYYILEDKGILIVRILHQSMDARRHLT
ncbi:type II toxin-antitoxin system RelE/ParE family toxin [Asticcacaulis sp. ZE23SCel15]|jgi:toxin ParE1/3/4|uniref:type II toxin-antitoxin system RelE/ParE family toxin n=1 Tax=Asticcacaulis sp. ZE23SCel15 TaxID=3059027 RepID=UPI00265D87DE|nr:type II toxin-antitoxin system RelE/ParE family toxin [Asticcacaulis sp. ZE23SCel15]WKL58999.1 type II toxin-antitoxin system RelE/ParE family toxin [Asticcacaulis sp. ZE23SCel15]